MNLFLCAWTFPVQMILAEEGQASPMGPSNTLFIGLLLAMVVFWVITYRGNQKDKKKRQEMIDNMGRNTRVLTIGGILGTVVAVKGDEVTVKVDETNNTKITFMKSAIQKVITEDEPKDEKK